MAHARAHFPFHAATMRLIGGDGLAFRTAEVQKKKNKIKIKRKNIE